MRILFIVHQFLPEFSAGTEIVTFGVARELIHRGHDVQIFAGFPGSGEALPDERRLDRYEYQGILVHRFIHAFVPMGDQSTVIEQEYDNHLAAIFVGRILDEFRPELVHAFHLGRVSASPIDVCAQRQIPFVFSAHDFWPICPISQLLLPGQELCQGPSINSANCLRHLALTPNASLPRRIFHRLPDALVAAVAELIRRRLFPPTGFNPAVRALAQRPDFLRKRLNAAARVIAPSRFMAEMLAGHGIDSHKIVHLPNGIDVGPIQKRDRRRECGSLRVGFIGTISEHKGVHVLFDALRQLEPEIDLTLGIHGLPGPSLEYGRRITSQAATDPRILMAGSFDHDRIGQVLADLDVVVIPSLWYENAPVVIFEARAAGCVVVASDLGGMSEAIRHDDNGLLFARGNSTALAAILRRLALDRGLLARLCASTNPAFSVIQHVNQLLESIYRPVIAENSARI